MLKICFTALRFLVGRMLFATCLKSEQRQMTEQWRLFGCPTERTNRIGLSTR